MVENVTRIRSGKCYVWNHVICTCENSKYLGSVSDDSVTTCNGIIETQRKLQQKYFNKKFSNKKCFNKKYFNKLLYFTIFLLLAIASPMTVSGCYYLQKYQEK